MKTQRAAAPRAGLALAFGAAGALLTLMPVGAGAQQPPAQDPGQAAQGQPGGGRRQRGFGQGGFGQGQMPFAQGTVSGGDPATGTIIINSQFGGGTQTIHVPNGTKGVALVQIDASKLAVGDTIQVQGVPKEITASTITAGEVPDFLRVQRGGPGGPGGAGGPGAAPGAAPAGGGGQPGQPGQPARPQAFANASGKVTKLEPLTISLSDEVTIVLKLGPNAKVMKIMPATINNIKLGDTVFATGSTGPDGSFTATGLGINVGGAGGRGMGGFGGPGGGGFGGPGGGGFGGGRGARGGRGGRGGGGAAGNAGGVGA